jgi:hypothetical protein
MNKEGTMTTHFEVFKLEHDILKDERALEIAVEVQRTDRESELRLDLDYLNRQYFIMKGKPFHSQQEKESYCKGLIWCPADTHNYQGVKE